MKYNTVVFNAIFDVLPGAWYEEFQRIWKCKGMREKHDELRFPKKVSEKIGEEERKGLNSVKVEVRGKGDDGGQKRMRVTAGGDRTG